MKVVGICIEKYVLYTSFLLSALKNMFYMLMMHYSSVNGHLGNAKRLIWLLKCFQEASGLRVNLSKSRLYGITVDSQEVMRMANLIHCGYDFLPFKYLGLPVGQKMNRVNSWNDVIERFTNRLSSWKS